MAVFLFLRRFRTTLLVAVAIPISVVATFVLIYFMRQAGLIEITLNVVSLAGLMLALGMLVDNSIVVIESIFRHHEDLGEDARTATLSGASEVAFPIAAWVAGKIASRAPGAIGISFGALLGLVVIHLGGLAWLAAVSGRRRPVRLPRRIQRFQPVYNWGTAPGPQPCKKYLIRVIFRTPKMNSTGPLKGMDFFKLNYPTAPPVIPAPVNSSWTLMVGLSIPTDFR